LYPLLGKEERLHPAGVGREGVKPPDIADREGFPGNTTTRCNRDETTGYGY
jgi:hypothetical protein